MPGPKFKEETYKQFIEKLKSQFSIDTLFQGETAEEKAAKDCFMKYNAGEIYFVSTLNKPNLEERVARRTEQLEANPFRVEMSSITNMLDAIELNDPKQEQLRDQINDKIDRLSMGFSGLESFVGRDLDKSANKAAGWNVALGRIREGFSIIDDLYELDEMTEFKFSNVPEMQALKTFFRGIKTMSDEIAEQTLLDQMEEVNDYVANGENEARQADQQLKTTIRENMANNIDPSRLDAEMTRNATIRKQQSEILNVSKTLGARLNTLAEDEKQKAILENQRKIAEAEYMISLLEVKLADRGRHVAEDNLEFFKERLAEIPKQVNGHLPLEYQKLSYNQNGDQLDEMGHFVYRDSYEEAVDELKRNLSRIRSATQKEKAFDEGIKRLKEEYSAPEDVEEGRDLYGEFTKAIAHQETAKKLKEMDIFKPDFVLNEESAQKAVDVFMELLPNELPGCDEGIEYKKSQRNRALEEYRNRRPEEIKELIERQVNRYENELPGLKEKFPRKFEMVTVLPQDIQKSIQSKEKEIADCRKRTADAMENVKNQADEIKARFANTGRSPDLSSVMKKAKAVDEYHVEEEISAQRQLIDSLTKELNGPDASSPYKKITDQITEIENDTGNILKEAQAAGDKYQAACEGYRAAKGRYDKAVAARDGAQKAQKYLNDNSMTRKYMDDASHLVDRLGKNKSFFHVNSKEFSVMTDTLKEFSRFPTNENLTAVANAAQHYLDEKAKGAHPFTSSMRSYRLNLARDILDFANANKARVDLASARNHDISGNFDQLIEMDRRLPLGKDSNEVAEELIKAGKKNSSFKEKNELGEANIAAAEKASAVAQKSKDFKTEFTKEYSSANNSRKVSPEAAQLVGKIL